MPERGKLMRLPMRYIDGQWVLDHGGDLPVIHGTSGELLVEARRVEESPQKRLFMEEKLTPILSAGTTLMAIVDVQDWRELTEEQKSVLIRRERLDDRSYMLPARVPLKGSYLVPVQLGTPTDWQIARYGCEKTRLWLRIQGVNTIGLISAPVILPTCVSPVPATSLNHAFTLLSETYEKWRRSHTGSAYRQFLYEEQNGEWYPLDLLRQSHLATESQRIAAELWKGIMGSLRGLPLS
jgi:hypothetical protein